MNSNLINICSFHSSTLHDVSLLGSIHGKHGGSSVDSHLVGSEGGHGGESKSRTTEGEKAETEEGLHGCLVNLNFNG
jgi:hypothetical protein